VDPFAALADPVRRGLLRALAAGPARVVDLAAAHPISRPAISKHLRLLTEAGLTSVEDRGRERHYSLDRSGLVPVSRLLDELRPAPPFADAVFDGLELEVRRTVRERGATRQPDQKQEDTA
jgi:DNA-binding transcriptional ArsR family regulator